MSVVSFDHANNKITGGGGGGGEGPAGR